MNATGERGGNGLLFLSARPEPAGAPPGDGRHARRSLAVWLLVCCALVFCMVVLGGVTRLSGSGLSIVDWEPIIGIVPPLTEEAWQQAFDRYKEFPEYRFVNREMDLAGFRSIYLVEYFHRLLGRLLGVVFLVPLAWFWLRGRMPARLAPKLGGLFLLGALQGLLGWFMVQSGLVDEPRVSQFRLAAHLLLAVAIFAGLLWLALGLLAGPETITVRTGRWLRRAAWAAAAIVLVMVTSGALVAGTRAGFILNTFPLMGGRWIPEGVGAMTPWWLNPLENAVTIQFMHRAIAVLVLAAVAATWLLARPAGVSSEVRRAASVLLALVAVQIGLGITTLVLRVPLVLGAAHQAVALLVVAAVVLLLRRLYPPRP